MNMYIAADNSTKYNNGATLCQCLSSSVNIISFAYTKKDIYIKIHTTMSCYELDVLS